MRRLIWVGLCLMLLVHRFTGLGWAAGHAPDRLALLVVAASSTKEDPDLQALVGNLQVLLSDPRLTQMKTGNLFMDVAEDQALATRLKVDPLELPCILLVQIDPNTEEPSETVFATGKIGKGSLQQVEQAAYQWISLTAGAAPTTPSNAVLPQGSSLLGGSELRSPLTSPNGEYQVQFQPQDGNLVVYSLIPKPQGIWATHSRAPGGRCQLSADGVLRVYDQSGQVVWESRSEGTFGRYRLEVGDDGDLRVLNEAGDIYWQRPRKNK